MNTHTKGKWEQVWHENNAPSTCTIKVGRKSICRISTNEEDANNANLISAAPNY